MRPLTRQTWLIALLAALPALAALWVFGIIETPDSPGYVAYAAQIHSWSVPTGSALLHEAPAPLSLFRPPGYPAILAALQLVVPQGWRLAVVLAQIAAQAALAALTFRTALVLGARRGAAIAAALLPAIGFVVVVQIAILTDALYATLATAAALLLVRRHALAAGLMLAAATLLREATPFIAVGYVPLALMLPGRRVTRAALVLLLPWVAAAGLMAWNQTRIGQPVLTTSRQTVMVQAVLPLLKHHLPVYDGDSLFDRTARDTVGTGEYGMIDELHRRLFAAGMTAPQIATEATSRYASAWRRFPGAMLLATVQNFRHEFLALPFQPVDTLGALMVYANWPRPVFDRLNLLWTNLRHGSALAGLEILLDVSTRLIGTALCLFAIVVPFRQRRPELIGLWLICGAFVGIYLPVHIEPRYLVPVVPLVTLIAACGMTLPRSRYRIERQRVGTRRLGLPEMPLEVGTSELAIDVSGARLHL
jgi:hypothetical protein